jgi:hypothetical protein
LLCAPFAAVAFLAIQVPVVASADTTSVIATWSRVGADGSTLASELVVSGSDLISQLKSSDGSVTTDSGPLSDIDGISATICTDPKVLMISVSLKSKSFHEISDEPRDPADFYEDMFFLVFGDEQSEKSVAGVLAKLTGVAVQYDADCSSGN